MQMGKMQKEKQVNVNISNACTCLCTNDVIIFMNGNKIKMSTAQKTVILPK